MHLTITFWFIKLLKVNKCKLFDTVTISFHLAHFNVIERKDHCTFYCVYSETMAERWFLIVMYCASSRRCADDNNVACIIRNCFVILHAHTHTHKHAQCSKISLSIWVYNIVRGLFSIFIIEKVMFTKNYMCFFISFAFKVTLNWEQIVSHH